MSASHIPVLLSEVLHALAPRPGQIYLDCTAGLGGHARAVAERIAPGGTVILNDVDPENLHRATAFVSAVPGVRVVSIQGNFASLPRELESRGLSANLVLADLGFASTQVDDPSRGLSFRSDGPLDMRMDPTLRATAADLVASLPEQELARIFREYGEERHAARVAQAIVRARANKPMTTTRQLAELIRAVVPRAPGGIDPATRTFQALRIAVNDELGVLEAFLAAIIRSAAAMSAHGGGKKASALRTASDWIAPGARVVVLSFHSLEDRPVKTAFREVTAIGGRELSGKTVTATEEEVQRNPRARSAKLRGVQLPGGQP